MATNIQRPQENSWERTQRLVNSVGSNGNTANGYTPANNSEAQSSQNIEQAEKNIKDTDYAKQAKEANKTNDKLVESNPAMKTMKEHPKATMALAAAPLLGLAGAGEEAAEAVEPAVEGAVKGGEGLIKEGVEKAGEIGNKAKDFVGKLFKGGGEEAEGAEAAEGEETASKGAKEAEEDVSETDSKKGMKDKILDSAKNAVKDFASGARAGYNGASGSYAPAFGSLSHSNPESPNYTGIDADDSASEAASEAVSSSQASENASKGASAQKSGASKFANPSVAQSSSGPTRQSSFQSPTSSSDVQKRIKDYWGSPRD